MINYYVFDRIEQSEYGFTGFKGTDSCEIFQIDGDSDDELEQKGFAKCDAPGAETFCVEESAWAALAK